MKLGCITLNSQDADAHADFYQKLLGSSVRFENNDGGTKYVGIVNEANGMILLFQEVEDYVAPVYPNDPGQQQSTAHIDFFTDDLERDVSFALKVGATLTDTQYSDKWRVLLDPMGHPFCIEAMEQ